MCRLSITLAAGTAGDGGLVYHHDEMRREARDGAACLRVVSDLDVYLTTCSWAALAKAKTVCAIQGGWHQDIVESGGISLGYGRITCIQSHGRVF